MPWGRVLGREGQWFHPPVIAKAAAAAPLRERLPAGVQLLVGAGFLVAIGYGIVAPTLPTYARSFGVGVAAASAVVAPAPG